MTVFAIAGLMLISSFSEPMPAQGPSQVSAMATAPPAAQVPAAPVAQVLPTVESPQTPEPEKPATVQQLSDAQPVYPDQDNPSPQQPAPPARLTLTAGTKVPLILTTPLNTRSSHAGDPVRAQIAFPISVDNNIAIPLGTYVEGHLSAVRRPNSSHRAAFTMNFTRLVFSNGYAVTLPDATAEAQRQNIGNTLPIAGDKDESVTRIAERQESAPDSGELVGADAFGNPDLPHTFAFSPVAFTFFADPQLPPPNPTPPPLPKVGPSKGVFIGVSVGAIAAAVIAFAAIAHHHGGSNDIYLDAGSKIDLILSAPLTIDAAGAAGAAPVTPNN
jgi:hypothetical protein